MSNLIEKTINNYIEPDDRVLAAVSGGPDSMALLYALNDIKHKFKFKLYAAHFNHNLRGKESDRDEKFVKQETKKLGITCFVKGADIRKISESKTGGIEKTAREERYRFFIETALKHKLNKIAVAHTKDDNAETMIYRFFKGSGGCGLRGIAPARKVEPGEFGTSVKNFKSRGGLTIIRPLINVSKRDILSYLKQNKIKYVIDRTNRSNVYDRNKIRNFLVPQIEKNFNPAIMETLSNTADIIGADDDFIAGLNLKNVKRFTKRIAHGTELNRKIQRLHKALRFRLIRYVLAGLLEHKRKINYTLISKIDSVVGGKNPVSMELPENYILCTDKDAVLITKKTSTFKYETHIVDSVSKPVIIEIYGEKIIICRIKPRKINFKDKSIAYVDMKEVEMPLTIRGRKPGDRFVPYGYNKPVRLKKFINSAKVKEPIIVVADNKKILWVAGERIDERAKISHATKAILKMEVI